MSASSSFHDLWRLMAMALAVLAAGCATAPGPVAFTPTAAETQLAELMVHRLEISRHVAWVKFQNGLPVSDPRREAELLVSLVQKGEALGLSPVEVETFFKAQIRASRRVQEELIASWKRGGTLPAFAPWDLRRHIRPKLDEISAGMLSALKARKEDGRRGFGNYAATTLRQRGFSWRVAQIATSPLR